MEQSSTHPSYVAHHFASAEQQRETSKLGMWVFLVTEVLFFGGLFCAYAIFRAWNPNIFHEAHKALDWRLGGLNTLVLITSSLTMALAIRSLQINRAKTAERYLWSTFVLAGVFLVIKLFEYAHKFHVGELWGKYYTNTEIAGTNPHLFFTMYFAMTGLHGIHVIIGMGVILWLIVRTRKGHFHADYYNPVEITGLYWHLVDLIWIFLFPLFYLVG